MDYDVFVNNIFAGKITKEDYSTIREAELKSGRNHLAQAANGVYMALSAFSIMLRILPLLVFYGLIALFVWEPEGFQQLSTAFQSDPSAFFRRSAELFLPSLFVFVIGFIGIIEAGSAFGFKNCFDSAINTRIRRKLGIQTTGEISVLRLIHQEEDRQNFHMHLLGLPVPIFVGYAIFVGLTFGLLAGSKNLPTTVIAAVIAYGILHYLYRNGKLDRFLSWTDKQRQRWEKRQQAKRKA